MNLINFLLQIDTALAQSVTGTVSKVGEDTTNEFSKLVSGFFTQVPLWIVAFVIAIFSYFVAILVRRSIEAKLAQEGLEEEHREIQIMAGRSSYFIVLTLGITIALSVVGIDLKPIVAAGAFGLGFALQDIIMNLIAGMMILASRHNSIGDVITVGGITGKIEEIQTRATIIKAFDGTKVVVPNANLFKNVVVSKTSNPYRKLTFYQGVGYASDLNDVMKLTLSVVKAIPWVLKKPKPRVIFTGWGDTYIDFKICVWIDSKGGKLIQVKNRVIMDLTEAYDKAGIDVPYPISTINFDESDFSDENKKAVHKQIRKMRKALKAKTVDSSSETVPFQAYTQIQQLPVQGGEISPFNQLVMQQSQIQFQPNQIAQPIQQTLPVSPTPTVNSSAQDWLQQALAQQMAGNTNPPAQFVQPVTQPLQPQNMPVQAPVDAFNPVIQATAPLANSAPISMQNENSQVISAPLTQPTPSTQSEFPPV